MAGKRVLVVDDDPDIIDYLGLFLEDHGYSVSSANRSSAALTALDEVDPDVVVLDVVLPGRSGLDLLVTIRRHDRWGSVPVIVLTGNASVVQDNGREYLRGHDLDRGADCVLAKPVDREALIECVEKLTQARETA